MRRRNVIAALILLGTGIFYAVLTNNLPTRGIDNTTDPSFFPWVNTVLFLGLSMALLVQGFLPSTPDGTRHTGRVFSVKTVSALVYFAVYLAILPRLGFLVANILLFAALMPLYGERRPLWLGLGSVLIPVALFFLFRDVFRILLPAGIASGLLG